MTQGPTAQTDAGGGACTCDVMFNGAMRTLDCGERTCIGDSEDDRLVTCTSGGAVLGERLCIQDQWDALESVAFDCGDNRECPAGTYCVLRYGPEPRRSECRAVPAACTPPRSAGQFCQCLEEDAINAEVCAGEGVETAGCAYDSPHAIEVGCHD